MTCRRFEGEEWPFIGKVIKVMKGHSRKEMVRNMKVECQQEN